MSSIPTVASWLLGLLVVAAGLIWLFHHFSPQQRCIRTVVAEGRLNQERAAAWCERNARWT